MTDPLAAGPAMDAALCELMGVEALEYRVVNHCGSTLIAFHPRERNLAEDLHRRTPHSQILAPYPALSTTNAGMGQVRDWLDAQGWDVAVLTRGGRVHCKLWRRSEADPNTGRPGPYAYGDTWAEAVGRAALKTRATE